MIDYFSHVTVLDHASKALAGITDPDVSTKRDQLLADAAGEPEAALLGAFVDHLLMHADGTGSELDLLTRAADLWARGIAAYEAVGAARVDIEKSFEKPAPPNADALFNGANDTLRGLESKLKEIVGDTDALRAAITPWPFFATPHPRQQDRSIADWGWGDRFLARRTEAFVRATFRHAEGRRGSAFAFGTLASYAGNVAGSAYIGQAIGGPRRLHPRRDRVARNTVGAWLHANQSLPDLQTLAAKIGGLSELPSDIAITLQKALLEAFPGMPAANLPLGLERLKKHLSLLSVFVRPQAPVPPPMTLMATMAPLDPRDESLHDNSDPYSVGQDDPPYGPPPPPGPDPQPAQPKGSSDNSALLGVCGAALCFALYLIIDGIVHLVQGTKYTPFRDLADGFTNGQHNPDDEHTGTAGQQLQIIASSSGGTKLINALFDYHQRFWQSLDQASAFLVKKGLIYPDALVLGSINFAQFTALPLQPTWPYRTERGADEAYIEPPTGPIEVPAVAASPFAAGATPLVFVDGPPGALVPSATREAVRVWLQIARGQLDSMNYDLDADQGPLAACWQVTAGTSISDNSLHVDVLPYAGL